jgi:hypothetical protein
MFDKVNKKALLSDLAKVATFNLVAHFLMHVRFNEPIFSEKFVYSLVFILLGFAAYHYLLDAHVNKFFEVKKAEKNEEKYEAGSKPMASVGKLATAVFR